MFKRKNSSDTTAMNCRAEGKEHHPRGLCGATHRGRHPLAADALAQQIGTGIELIGRRKDGSEFPIEIMLSPLESAEGILVTAAIRDISVRKAAETHLAQMEGSYRGLLEAAPDAMVVVNSGGEIVLLNVQAEKQFGYSRDELLGQQVKNIIPAGFCGTAHRRRHAHGGRRAGAADRHRHRAHRRGARMAASSPSRSCSARSKAPKASW